MHTEFYGCIYDGFFFFLRNKHTHEYDIVLTGNSPIFLDSLVEQLSQAFELKDGDLHYFLGIHITCTSKGLCPNQSKYAHDLLTKHNMLTSNPANLPPSLPICVLLP